MERVTRSTFSRAVDILSAAYVDNPTVIASVYRNTDRVRRRLFRLLCKEMVLRKALYITENQQGVAAYYIPSDQKPGIQIALIKLNILFTVTGLKNGISSLMRTKKISKRRKPLPCIYFWLLAVHPDFKGLEAIQDIRDTVFRTSKEKALPILAETPLPRTKLLYERYGFSTYDKLQFQDGLIIWLMERDSTVRQK